MNLLLRPIFIPPRPSVPPMLRAQRTPPLVTPQPQPLELRGRIDGRTTTAGFIYGTAVEVPDDDDLLFFDLL